MCFILQEIPLNVLKGLNSVKCTEKEEIRFECKLNKELKPEEVGWYRDGLKLADQDENGRISILAEGDKQVLVIKNACLDDAGTYEIRCKGVKSAASAKVKGQK